jgi:hypothetical protein
LRAQLYLFDTCAEILEHLAMHLNSEPKDPSSKNDANFCVLLRLVCCLLDLGIGFLLWNMGLPKHGTQDRGEILRRRDYQDQLCLRLSQGLQQHDFLQQWKEVDRILTEVVEAGVISPFPVDNHTLAIARDKSRRSLKTSSP